MADTLDLQLADEDVIATPADFYRSGNSVYTCLALSMFSMNC